MNDQEEFLKELGYTGEIEKDNLVRAPSTNKLSREFWKKVHDEAANWRFNKLLEDFGDAEDPIGVLQIIDACVWGKQNRHQKDISNFTKWRCIS